jgi:glycosyltransferase involved in cell wall biosynthesis
MPGVRLDILGDGPERTRLEVLTVDLGLQDRVRFFGWLDQAQCARQLRDSDVLVLPSLCECGGAVVLEAMACGIPVVATDWGGPADYLDASCGFLVPPSTRESFVAGLASAMRTLAEDPALRQRLGARGREKVQREFDWTSKVDRMLQIYDHAIVVGPR